MVSPTSQSENPKSCRGPIERTIVDSRERASPQLFSPPSPWKIGCDFDSKSFDLRGRKREGKKEREKQGGRIEREREREANALAIVCQHLDRCTASPTLSNVHPGNPREKHDPEISPGTPPTSLPPIENTPNTPENTSVEFNHINYE